MWDDVQLLSKYIEEILESLIRLHTEVPAARASSNNKTVSALVGFFVASVVIASLLYFPSIINSLNKSIKGNRALLLLLPEDVISGVRVLKDTMQELAKRLSS